MNYSKTTLYFLLFFITALNPLLSTAQGDIPIFANDHSREDKNELKTPLYLVDGLPMSQEQYLKLNLKASQINGVFVTKNHLNTEPFGRRARFGIVHVFTSLPILVNENQFIFSKHRKENILSKFTENTFKVMHVVKDEKIVAKYGERARNGVIVYSQAPERVIL